MTKALLNAGKLSPRFSPRRRFARRAGPGKGRNRIKYLLLGIIVLVLLIGALIILVSTKNLLPVGKVNCRGGWEVTEAQRGEWCAFIEENIIGRSLIFLDEAKLRSLMKTAFPAVSKISFEKNFPAAVSVMIAKRLPVFSVFAEGEATTSATASGFFWVDETGALFSEVENPEIVPALYFPEATGSSNFKVGGTLDSGFLRFTAEVLSKLKAEGLESVLLRQGTDNYLNVTLVGGVVVQFSPRKPVDPQVTILQLMIEKYRMEGRALKRVDLRFQDPVVEY
ncbi:MAG: hypothetical protein AAB486_00875 [Patescibacteria group bacterium]